MKKTLFGIAALAGLMLASCANENFADPSAKKDGKVSFNINLAEEIGSRAYGDGTTVNTLYYAIFDEDNDAVTADGASGTTSISTTSPASISVTLPSGSYNIVCWAQASAGSIYTPDLPSVSIDYSNAANNNESNDAFCAVANFEVGGMASEENVTLTRPFAQINLGLPKELNITPSAGATSAVEIEGTNYTAVNLLTNAYTNGTSPVNFTAANLPTGDLTVTIGGKEEEYTYLSMTYFLVNDKADVNLTYTLTGVEGYESLFFESVPIQTNYRTNILGKEISGQVDFSISLVPAFGGDKNVGLGDDEEQEPEPEPQPNVTVTAVTAVVQGDNVNLTAKYDATDNATVTGATFILSPVLARAATEVEVPATSYSNGNISATYALSNLEPSTKYNVTVTVNYNEDQVTPPSAGETTGQDVPSFNVPVVAAPLYISGYVNGQSFGEGDASYIAMTPQGNGIYTITNATLKNGTSDVAQFGFFTKTFSEAGNWDTLNHECRYQPSENNKPATVGGTANSMNFPYNQDWSWNVPIGVYTFTVDINNKTFTAVKTGSVEADQESTMPSAYIVGDFNGWGFNGAIKNDSLTESNGQLVYTWNNASIKAGDGTVDQGFKFAAGNATDTDLNWSSTVINYGGNNSAITNFNGGSNEANYEGANFFFSKGVSFTGKIVLTIPTTANKENPGTVTFTAQ